MTPKLTPAQIREVVQAALYKTRAIKSKELRASCAARLWSLRIDWHIVGYWDNVHEIILGCYAEAQRIADAGGYHGKEF